MRRYGFVVVLAVLGLLALLQLEQRLLAQAQPPVTIAQAEATRPGVPPASVPPSETLSWMLALSYVANAIMARMKTTAWFPLVQKGAGRINVLVAGFLAAIAAAGIHTEFDKVAGSFLITGLTAAGITHFLGEWLRQWAIQQWAFNTTKVV